MVVPAFREEHHVARVIETMPALVDHVVVVDDCSPDATGEAARGVGDPRVEVIRHETNRGVGGAIVTGHRRALELGADISVVMAGDGQMDPAHLTDLLDPIVEQGYGFAKANRFHSPTSSRDTRTAAAGSALAPLRVRERPADLAEHPRGAAHGRPDPRALP